MMRGAVAVVLLAQALWPLGRARAASHRLRTQMGCFTVAPPPGRSLAAAAPMPQMLAAAALEAADSPLAPLAAHPALSLVHFQGPPGADTRARLAALGVEVHGHLPDDTLWVSLPDEAARAALLAWPEVAGVVPAPPWLSIEPALLAQTAAGVTLAPDIAAGEARSYLIEAAQTEQMPALLAAVQAQGGELVDHRPGSAFARARLGAAAVEALAQLPTLLHIGLDRPPTTCNDNEYGVVQAGAGMSQKSPIWAQGLRGQGQTVGIADTSFNIQSCFLSGAGKLAQVVYFNFAAPTQTTSDMLHGTHVAGIVGGDRGGDGVYQSQDGEAPAVTLVLQSIGSGSAERLQIPSDFATLTQGAIAHGGYIHSNSWSYSYNGYTLRSRSIDAAVYSQPRMLVLFSNDNLGPALGTTSSEANGKNVVAVGAYNALTPEEVVAYSSRGPTADGRIRPHITLPGDQVISADYSQACGTRTLSGTSMATPAGAAATALIRQYLAEGFYLAGAQASAGAITPSGALLKAMLLAGTDNMTGTSANGDIPSMGQGFGRLNLSQVLWFASEGPPALWLKDAGADDALQAGDSLSYPLSVRAGADLRVVLAWTDPPALAQAATTLVNDLDLEVEAPDGTVYVGNAMRGGMSVAGGSADRLNTEEMVSLSGAAPGTYLVRVIGHAVPLGPQAFGLAVRGGLGDRPGADAWQDAAPLGAQTSTQSAGATALTLPSGAVTLASLAAAAQNAPTAGSGTLEGGPDIIDTRVSCQGAPAAPAPLVLWGALRLWAASARRAGGRGVRGGRRARGVDGSRSRR